MGRVFGLLMLLMTMGLNSPVLAQEGSSAVGLRLSPDGAGITGKYFLSKTFALETQFNIGGLMSGNEGRSLTVAGIAVYHIPLPDPSWRVYFGGGVHAGSWERPSVPVDQLPVNEEVSSKMIAGINGLGGVEYQLKSAPVSLSADFKPAINLISESDIFPHNVFGLSVRYYLGR